MHDIGKIGLPDRVLLKPGPLTADEWDMVRQHPLMGATILAGSDSDVINLGEVVALTHHERWDGSGYPHHLVGSAIPQAGRIVGVVDAFDAMTTGRPYDAPVTPDRAFARIRALGGSAFDPRVVEAFFAAEHDVLEIRATYRDRHASPLVEQAGQLMGPPPAPDDGDSATPVRSGPAGPVVGWSQERRACSKGSPRGRKTTKAGRDNGDGRETAAPAERR
jgi:hypothetical protein